MFLAKIISIITISLFLNTSCTNNNFNSLFKSGYKELLLSPDKSLEGVITAKEGKLFYSIKKNNSQIIDQSILGIRTSP